ncbi:MAG: zinc-dependent metalloprotease [Bacteroidota bacterium]
MKFLNLLFLLLLSSTVIAQGPVYDQVQRALAQSESHSFEVVRSVSDALGSAGVQDELKSGLLVEFDFDALQGLRRKKPASLALTLPLPELGDRQVKLIKSQVLAPDFQVFTSSGTRLDYQPGAYYRGVLVDDPTSLVSFSIFDDEVIGMINTKQGNFVIGKLQKGNATTHLIYNDRDLLVPVDMECGTPDDGVVYRPEELTYTASRAPGDCIRIYVEIDDDVVTNKGGATGATNYITGLFNESFTLYANDGLTLVISEIKAWTTPAPYSGSSSSAMLNSYQANTGAFNGDLSHLVSYQASGGIAAGFTGVCNSNVDNSKCFSSISSTYANVPAYSFSVMVVTHEMGHLIGSRHTHACVWNGNGTAIDGCAGATEGFCSLPGSPSSGGTIMSYCHLTTGIDFTQGFGPQPRAVIQNTVNNASCLTNCGSGPTCSDGIQNGQETGVDCGGPDCPPCSSTCNDNEVVITINLDNYPEETSWSVTNSSGGTVGSGGTYGSQPDGSTVVESLCLPDGCYTFTINDAYGDGICCGYGNGSYSVTSGGQTLAAGGNFGASENTNFCLGGPPPPTCDDGVQNGQETGVDCGGPDCPACPTGGVILASYFETGWDGWTDGGSDCYRYSGSRSYEGSYSIRLRDNSGTNSAMTSGSYNVSAYSQLDINFYFYPNSMENGEDFWVRYYDGSSWSTVAAYASGSNFNNGTFYVATVTINSASYNFPTNARFRFQCDASANADQVYIDQVTITASSGALASDSPIATIERVDSPIRPDVLASQELGDPAADGLQVFPNPAQDVITVRSDREIQSIRVISTTGQVLQNIRAANFNEQIDLLDLSPGIYYLLIEMDGEMVPQKFVKR